MFKKIFAVLLATTLIAGSLTVGAVENNETSNDAPQIKTITPIIKNNVTTFYDQDGNVVDPTLLNAEVDVEKKLPSSYDLRDYGRSTSVKDQGNFGLCWNFASTASMESNIITQGLNNETADTIDLSEAGSSWYIHTNTTDTSSPIYNEYVNDPTKGTTGANSMTAADSLSSGFGAYPEAMFEYDSYDSGYAESLRFYSDYRLKDYVELDKTNTDLIKQRIMDYGAAYYTYDSIVDCYSYTDEGITTFYDSDKSNKPPFSGHAVTVIGWDDNFSKENFQQGEQPENDGAWLIKNSWGEINPIDDPDITPDEKYVGYFWASYESKFYDITQFEMQTSDNLENIYQHQASALEYAEVDSVANIFTAKSNEELEQVCFGNTGELDADVSIYKLDDNYSSPVDGTLLAKFEAKSEYTGTHMIECPDGIILNEGDVFSVVIDSDENIFIKCKSEDQNNAPEVFSKSYVSLKNNAWIDIAEDIIDTSYVAIKAYTSNITVDNSKLNEAIMEADSFVADKNIPQSKIDELNTALESAKKVASDKNASQISINNAYCELKGKYEELNQYCFYINSIEDFFEYSNASRNNPIKHKYVCLNTDLDLSGYVFDKPINADKTFTGTFDGNGHTIKNFTCKSSLDILYSGLFASTSNAIIKDLTFDNAYVISLYSSGIFSSISSNTQFINCTVKNSVSQGDDAFYASIMAGASDNCTFTNCTIENSTASGANAAVGLFTLDVSGNNIYDNCTTTNYELKSTYKITDNMGFNVIFENYSTSTVGNNSYAIITVTDDNCTVKELVGEIKALERGSRLLKATDGIYTIGKFVGTTYLYASFAESDEPIEFYYRPDLINEGVVITGYSGRENKSSITFPSEIFGAPVISLGNQIMFPEDTTMYTSVTIPGEIKTISENAFCELTSLETVIIEDGVEEIGNNAFKGCNLKQITLPDSIRTIGDYAFATCPSTSVVLGKNIEKIGTHAFGYTGHKGSGVKDIKIENFVINGYAGTPAEEYAKSNGFKFVDLTTQQPVIPETSYDYSSYCKGDVNLDGIVNITDATLIQKYLVGSCELNEIQLSNALTGNSEIVSIADATRIMQYNAGIIESL